MTIREHVERLLRWLREQHDAACRHAGQWIDSADNAGHAKNTELEAEFLWRSHSFEKVALAYREAAIELAAEFGVVVLEDDPFHLTPINPKNLRMGKIVLPKNLPGLTE